uniref:Uncharacterized protein n=1 Tax=Ochrobactrum phage ORM_20 TaxID=2985243 RepID=A0A9N6ZGG7_9VIRU|nr:hypothetical protein ORM20_00114 [Ochrobactrum phage ORM_20]
MSFRSTYTVYVKGISNDEMIAAFVPKDLEDDIDTLVEELTKGLDEGLIGSWTKGYYWYSMELDRYFFLDGITSKEYQKLFEESERVIYGSED